MVGLQVLGEGARRKIRFRLNFFKRDNGGFPHTGMHTRNEIAFGHFDIGSIGICLLRGFIRFFLQPLFFKLSLGDRHHGFIKTVDGLVILPIQRAVEFQFLVGEFTVAAAGNSCFQHRSLFGRRLGLIWM